MKPRALLCMSPIGIFAFSESGELLHYSLFSSSPEKAAEEFSQARAGDLEAFELIDSEKGYKFLRTNFRDYAVSLGFAGGGSELTAFLSRFAEIISRKKMKALIGRDRLVAQASNALEDAVKMHNLVSERLREWFSLHYPELKQKDIASLVAAHGRRDSFPGFRESAGADLSESDEKILVEYAAMSLAIAGQRKSLEKYIGQAMKEIAPNFSSLIEPLLAARFLALAGSMEKLAKMPSSTIQLLGAEKALFRHLRKQGRSPKFGIIFLDPRVQNAEDGKKGRIARILASKLTVAIRIDVYSRRDDSERLTRELKEELGRV